MIFRNHVQSKGIYETELFEKMTGAIIIKINNLFSPL